MWPLGQGNGGDSLPPIAALGATEPISQKVNEFQTATTAANDPNADSALVSSCGLGSPLVLRSSSSA